METPKQQKKDVYAVIVDIVIVSVAVLISIILLIQHANTTNTTIDTREDRYFRSVDPEKDLILGNPEADLFMVEYGDLECPYCKEFHSYAKTLIQSDWGVSGKIAWVWRNGFHINETSLEKARTLECVRLHAGEQARSITWKFIEESLLGGVEEIEYPHERYKALMEKLNIPFTRIEECKNNNEAPMLASILQSMQDVKELDIEETPYLQFISGNGELLFESVGALTPTQLEGYISSILQSSKR